MALLAEDNYWQVGGDASQFWSTAQKAYVAPGNAGLLAWLASGRTIIPIVSEAVLNQALADLGLSKLAPVDLVEVAELPIRNYRALIRRRARALADGGDAIGALILLKTIKE